MADTGCVLPRRDIGADAEFRWDGMMIADDFKAINAAMKANEQPRGGGAIEDYKLEWHHHFPKPIQPGDSLMIVLSPCVAAARFAEVASRDMQDYPVRDYLGDPEC